jgi:murein DD-endopeptidase MepM/ murein hydrolase activator NlpD
MKKAIRKLLVSTSFIFVFINVFAQSETALYKTVAEKFERFYNAAQYDSIFSLYTLEMQQALPLEKTTAFLSSVQQDAGKIINREFVKYNATYAAYKTNFERAIYTVEISVNKRMKMNGFSIKPFTDETIPKPERNDTKLNLPFKGEWTIVWGGDTKELNYHVDNAAQKNAFDIVVTGDNGKSFKTDGKTNKDYYAFGKELLAPCDGEVVLVVDGVKDNIPGEMNSFHTGGNTVIIKTAKNEYLVFCHFMQQSIVVKVGYTIKQGQLLGMCGNSGNSSEPHLHFHIQNTESMNEATGIKCHFDTLLVNGNKKTDYSPIKNDKVKSE